MRDPSEVTDEEAREAKRLHLRVGFTVSEIAERYGVRIRDATKIIYRRPNSAEQMRRIGLTGIGASTRWRNRGI